MKKIIIVLLSIFIILTCQSISAFSIIKNNHTLVNRNIDNKEFNDIPYWADGYLNGTWGIREYNILLGMIEIPIGNISGFYGKVLGPINYFSGQFYPIWNQSKLTNITGFYFSSFILGRIGDIDVTQIEYDIKTNESGYGGFGSYNQTNFNYRIVGKSGPTIFLKGTFSKF